MWRSLRLRERKPRYQGKGVQEIEGKLRAMLLALKSRMGGAPRAKERTVAFMPEYVAYLSNRLCRGDDGTMVYERVKGKKPMVPGI